MKFRLSHERRVLLFALAGGLPALLVALVFLLHGKSASRESWMLAILVAGCWIACCLAAKERVSSPLRTLANLLEAMREGDYSIRARAENGIERPSSPRNAYKRKVW